MGLEKSYFRKISSKEAKNGFIFILKDKLSFFPPLGEVFALKFEGLTYNTYLKSYPCVCRGPDKPHEHYFIPWNNLQTGDKVEIKKNPSNTQEYSLNIIKKGEK
jgi:hypothetical protein